MIAPPRVAEWLLASFTTTSDGEAVAGDLYEEFNGEIVPARGVMRARCWYWWQVVRSLSPLFFRRWERASVSRASTAILGAALVATIPASLLVVLRTFILQQVPLKTTSELSIAFALTLAATVLVAGALGLCAALSILKTDSRNR